MSQGQGLRCQVLVAAVGYSDSPLSTSNTPCSAPPPGCSRLSDLGVERRLPGGAYGVISLGDHDHDHDHGAATSTPGYPSRGEPGASGQLPSPPASGL